MRITTGLRQYTLGITLFTRRNCSLCETAKAVLHAVRARRSYRYEEIDVMSSGQESWRIYEFDTPVIHVQRLISSMEKGGQQPTQGIGKECGKLMHRFTEDQVEKLMDEAEKT